MFACFTPKPGDSPEQPSGGKAGPAGASMVATSASGHLPRVPQHAPPAGVLSGPAGTHARAFARALVEKAEYR